MKNIILLLSLIMVFSCNKESSPESSLENLVSMRFDGSSRSEILEIVTGKLHDQISNMSEENIKLFLENEGLRNRGLTITLKNCEGTKCYLTYILKYNDERPQGTTFKVEVKKIAQIDLIEGEWLISDISNVKTYIDSKKEIKTQE